MPFFRSLNANQDDWVRELLDSGTIPSSSGYIGLSALRNSDVLTAVSIVAGDIARFPIRILNNSTGRDSTVGEINYLLNTKTNSRLSAYAWKFAMVVNAILTGNSYSRIVRDPLTDDPIEIEFYLPSQTYVDYTDVNNIKYMFTPYNQSKSIEVSHEDVIHWKFFSTDSVMGRSPLLSLGDEINLQQSGINTLQKFFKNGMKSSVLTAKGKLSKEARKKIREDFAFAQENAGSGEPIVVDDTMKFDPLEIDTNVLQLISSNNYSTAQIAKALRVPAYRLAQNSPNQSIKQLSSDYLINDLPFYFEPIASEFEMKMFNDDERHNYHIEFDTRVITGMTVDDASKLVNNGLATPDEAREKVGLTATGEDNMNRFQSTLNTVYLDKKENYQKLKGGDVYGKGNTDSDSTSGDEKFGE